MSLLTLDAYERLYHSSTVTIVLTSHGALNIQQNIHCILQRERTASHAAID